MAAGDLKRGPKPKERFLPGADYRKRCNTCNRRRLAKFFHTRSASFDGLAFTCKDCVREYGQARLTDEDMRRENRYRATAWNKANPEARRQIMRKNALLRMYGLTQHDFDKMLKKQNGVCAICRMPETQLDRTGKVRHLSVDHDHVTGRVRGLLCCACNVAVGMLKDDVAIAQRAVAYLKAGGSNRCG